MTRQYTTLPLHPAGLGIALSWLPESGIHDSPPGRRAGGRVTAATSRGRGFMIAIHSPHEAGQPGFLRFTAAACVAHSAEAA